MANSINLTAPAAGNRVTRIVVVGEVLWDIFHESSCLGGAPLNFAVHCQRLGHNPLLISAVGADELGKRAAEDIRKLGLDTRVLRVSRKWQTGTATVDVDAEGHPTFRIQRPAAYDDVQLSLPEVQTLQQMDPSWLYFGTLFPSLSEPKAVLQQLLKALPNARRFYDLNLRPGFDSPELVASLIAQADVVKLNESEAAVVSGILGLPSDLESFCRCGVERFRWSAACVTLGARGCVILKDKEFFHAEGCPIHVADTVGAGDAFAAALLHGLVEQWPIAEIAHFANRIGALVASRTGAIPEWNITEAAKI